MIHILTDSTSDIPKKIAEQMNIEVLPLRVSFGEAEYLDRVDISSQEFYKKMAETKELPVTSQIAPDTFLNRFRDLVASEDELIYIAIGSKFSGTYQSATIAKDELGLKNVYLVDSKQVTIGIAILIKYAVDLRDAGKTAQEIVTALEKKKEKIVLFAVLDNLTNLYKGGRLTKSKAIMGTVLGIKPILKVKNCEIIPFDTKRGFQKSMETTVGHIKDTGFDTRLPMALAHANSPQLLDNFKDILPEDILKNSFLEVSLGPVIATHAGANAVAAAFFEK
ncbi:MAG: DegV family protein [Oscillospiraceae bacterium]